MLEIGAVPCGRDAEKVLEAIVGDHQLLDPCGEAFEVGVEPLLAGDHHAVDGAREPAGVVVEIGNNPGEPGPANLRVRPAPGVGEEAAWGSP